VCGLAERWRCVITAILSDSRSRLLREAAGIGASDLFGVSADEYCGADGTIMRREYGKTPNGNPLAGRWVLRCPCGTFVTFDQYRNDIAEEYGLRLLSPNSQAQERPTRA
jgi:hypothetical protein